MLADLRLAARSLVHTPGFTLVAALTLALGIGANAALFAALQSVFLRQLPYSEPEQLVWLHGVNFRRDAAGTTGPVSSTDVQDVQAQGKTLAATAVYADWNPILSGATGGAERTNALLVGHGFFDVLRATPLHGRLLQPEDQKRGHDRVVVLSHGIWMEKYQGDPAVIGRTVRLNARDHVVVGVLRPDFAPLPQGITDEVARLYRPLAEEPTNDNRGSRYLGAIGRLKPGVTLAEASAEVRGISQRLAEEYKSSNTGYLMDVRLLGDAITGGLRTPLFLLYGAVLLVLLIACANVANLLLARAAARRRVHALCAALGASGGRLVRATFAECFLLALLGGGGGLLLGVWGVEAIAAYGASIHPLLGEISLGWPVFALTGGLLLLAVFGFGLVPAIQAARPDLMDTMKTGAAGAGGSPNRRMSSALIAAEVALSLVLLVASGLLLKSLARLQRVDPGFDYRNVLSLQLTLPFANYDTAQKQAALYREVLSRLSALPGVTAAAMVNPLPLSRNFDGRALYLEGRQDAPGQRPQADMYLVSPGYFAVLDLKLRAGRLFTDADNDPAAPRVAVVNEAMARKLWPGENPIGRRLRTGGDTDDEQGWRRVVGVVNDVRHYGLDRAAPPQFYLPQNQFLPWGSFTIALRTVGDPTALLAPARAAVFSLDRELPLSGVTTLEQLLAESLALRRFALTLLGLFAGVAVLLAAIGIYGVVAYLTARRTREFGIRLALGATAGGMRRLVLRHGLTIGVPGLILGLLGSFVATRFVRSLLFEIDPLDPLVLGGASLLLLGIVLLACLIPARRAARTDPMTVLRSE